MIRYFHDKDCSISFPIDMICLLLLVVASQEDNRNNSGNAIVLVVVSFNEMNKDAMDIVW